jgi:DNA-binding LacI/PurR family transcriptional regulator
MPYFADLADAVISCAKEYGMNVLIEPAASSRRREKEVLNRVHGRFADGIIYCPLGIGTSQLEHIDIGVPMVVLSDPPKNPQCDYVMIRDREAGESATDCLIRGGARKIVAVGLGAGQDGGPAEQRFLGYLDSLRKHGIRRDRRREVATETWHRRDGVYAVEWLRSHDVDFDAVFAFTDQIAAGIMYALESVGVRVPDDVSVIGFDNNEESRYLLPPLTTIDPGVDAIARQAVSMLARRISTPTEQGNEVARVDFTLVERQSTQRGK